MNFNVSQLLENVVNANASDLHISVGDPPYLRINTKLQPVANAPALSLEDVNYFLSQLLEEDQLSILDVNREIDFSVALGNKARFRVNAFYQKGAPAIALRLIPMKIPTLESLHLPDVLTRLCDMKQGLFLVVGPTGHGKSTTIASMIETINKSKSQHYLTF